MVLKKELKIYNMKLINYLFIILVMVLSCKSQSVKTQNNQGNDIIIFNFYETKGNISSKKENNHFIQNLIVHKKNKFMFEYKNDYVPSPKNFEFYKNNDTMRIKCICNWYNNLIIDDLVFMKGYYELNVIESLKTKPPKIIKTDFESNNISFYKFALKDKGVIWKKLDE